MLPLAELLRPIPGPNPSGENTRYTGIYDQIREARREDPDLPQGDWAHARKTADWAEVVELCNDALAHKTKDLQIAAWFTEGMLRREGFSGLKQGLDLLRSLVENFWETVYPLAEEDDLELRAAPLVWVGSRLDEATTGVHPAKPDELDDCLSALGELDGVCAARFGDATPNFGRLWRSLESIRRTLPRAASKPEADTGAFTRMFTAPPPPAAMPPDPGSSPGEFTRMFTGPLPPAPIPPPAPDATVDRLHFTVTAPMAIRPAGSVGVTVWVHLESQRAMVIERALEQHRSRDAASILRVTKGPVGIARGSMLSIRLRVSGARVEDPEDTVWWDGEIGCANFVVTLPSKPESETLPGTAVVYLNGVQMAKIQFVLQVGKTPPDGVVAATETRNRKAFASYASADRDDVLARLQGIRKAAPQLDIFFDVLSLRSGQSWEREIEQLIQASDVFYLFWSIHASRSSWVEREWRTALRTGGRDFIDPVPLQSPEEAPPPPELAGLHFNDWMLAFRRRGLAVTGRAGDQP